METISHYRFASTVSYGCKVSIKLKRKVYQMTRPAMLYGSEYQAAKPTRSQTKLSIDEHVVVMTYQEN